MHEGTMSLAVSEMSSPRAMTATATADTLMLGSRRISRRASISSRRASRVSVNSMPSMNIPEFLLAPVQNNEDRPPPQLEPAALLSDDCRDILAETLYIERNPLEHLVDEWFDGRRKKLNLARGEAPWVEDDDEELDSRLASHEAKVDKHRLELLRRRRHGDASNAFMMWMVARDTRANFKEVPKKKPAAAPSAPSREKQLLRGASMLPQVGRTISSLSHALLFTSEKNLTQPRPPKHRNHWYLVPPIAGAEQHLHFHSAPNVDLQEPEGVCWLATFAKEVKIAAEDSGIRLGAIDYSYGVELMNTRGEKAREVLSKYLEVVCTDGTHELWSPTVVQMLERLRQHWEAGRGVRVEVSRLRNTDRFDEPWGWPIRTEPRPTTKVAIPDSLRDAPPPPVPQVPLDLPGNRVPYANKRLEQIQNLLEGTEAYAQYREARGHALPPSPGPRYYEQGHSLRMDHESSGASSAPSGFGGAQAQPCGNRARPRHGEMERLSEASASFEHSSEASTFQSNV